MQAVTCSILVGAQHVVKFFQRGVSAAAGPSRPEPIESLFDACPTNANAALPTAGTRPTAQPPRCRESAVLSPWPRRAPPSPFPRRRGCFTGAARALSAQWVVNSCVSSGSGQLRPTTTWNLRCLASYLGCVAFALRPGASRKHRFESSKRQRPWYKSVGRHCGVGDVTGTML